MASGLARGIEHISRGLQRRDERMRQKELDAINAEERAFERGRLEREEGRIVEDRKIAAEDRARRIKQENEDREFEIEGRGLKRRGKQALVRAQEAAAEQAQRDLISDTQQRKQEALAALSENPDPANIEGIIQGLNESTGTQIDPNSIEFLPDGSIAYNEVDRGMVNGQPGFSFAGERQTVPASLIKSARHRIARRELGDAVKFGPDDYRIYNPETNTYERTRGVTDKSERLAHERIEKKIDTVDDKLESVVEGNPSQREWADQMLEYANEAMKINPPRPGVPSIRSLDARTIKRVINNILKTTQDLDAIEQSMINEDFSEDEILQEKLQIQEDVLNLFDLALRDAAGIQVSDRTRRLLSTPRRGPRGQREDRESRPGFLEEISQGMFAQGREGLERAEQFIPGNTGDGTRRFK